MKGAETRSFFYSWILPRRGTRLKGVEKEFMSQGSSKQNHSLPAVKVWFACPSYLCPGLACELRLLFCGQDRLMGHALTGIAHWPQSWKPRRFQAGVSFINLWELVHSLSLTGDNMVSSAGSSIRERNQSKRRPRDTMPPVWKGIRNRFYKDRHAIPERVLPLTACPLEVGGVSYGNIFCVFPNLLGHLLLSFCLLVQWSVFLLLTLWTDHRTETRKKEESGQWSDSWNQTRLFDGLEWR